MGYSDALQYCAEKGSQLWFPRYLKNYRRVAIRARQLTFGTWLLPYRLTCWLHFGRAWNEEQVKTLSTKAKSSIFRTGVIGRRFKILILEVDCTSKIAKKVTHSPSKSMFNMSQLGSCRKYRRKSINAPFFHILHSKKVAKGPKDGAITELRL